MVVLKKPYRKIWSEESSCYIDTYFRQTLAFVKGKATIFNCICSCSDLNNTGMYLILLQTQNSQERSCRNIGIKLVQDGLRSLFLIFVFHLQTTN